MERDALPRLLHKMSEDAKMLGVKRMTYQRLICDGELEPVRIGRRPLIAAPSIEGYAERFGPSGEPRTDPTIHDAARITIREGAGIHAQATTCLIRAFGHRSGQRMNDVRLPAR